MRNKTFRNGAPIHLGFILLSISWLRLATYANQKKNRILKFGYDFPKKNGEPKLKLISRAHT